MCWKISMIVNAIVITMSGSEVDEDLLPWLTNINFLNWFFGM